MNIFSTQGFPARWYCGSGWAEAPWLGWLHILSDIFTFLAYYAVPIVTIYYVAKNKNVKFPPIFYFFLAAIFLTCGTGHLLEAIIFWVPVYRLAGWVKLVTAVASCGSVVVLARILPVALELKSGREFQRVLTERQHALESLEHERFLLKTLLENLPDAIYFKDDLGRFSRVSRSLAARFGCDSADEVSGKSDADYFSPDFAVIAISDEKEVMRTGRSMVGKAEQVNWPHDGLRWVSTTKVPLRNEKGNIVGTFGISHDVTEIKTKEEELRVSEERYALAVQGSSAGIWDWDLATNRVYYAPRFREMLGYQEEEFPNHFDSFESRLHPDDVKCTFDAINAHLEHRKPYDVEYRLKTKSGDYRWFRALGQALWDENDRATRMAGSINDITDRHRANERLRCVVSASPTALVMVDQSRKLTLVNSQAGMLFGYDPSELLGREIEILIPARFHDSHSEFVASYFGHLEPRQMGSGRDLKGIKKSGEEFPVEVALSPLELDEGVFVVAGIVDITERQHAMEAISHAKEAAEASNRAKSEFLANMSHEIRTPMNAVIGMTDLLLDTELLASQREYLMMVSQAGESLLTIINDILDFSKIEAGRIELEAVDFAIWDVVGDTLKSLALRAHSKGLELAYHISPDTPAMLTGDPVRLRQVIVNLVGNAIKFTESGEILVDVTCVAQNETGVQLHFAVIDTGVGIAPGKQNLIFDAFTQADTSTTRRFGGTGLGLAISSRLVSLMGGELDVHSEFGKGSTFSFAVWLGRSTSLVPHEIGVQPEFLKDLEVLIVDDNATNRRILEEMVRSWGMIPMTVSSASQALQQLNQRTGSGKPIPLLLTDVHMPEMDGLTLIEQLRGQGQYNNLPIIVLSSGDRGTEADRCVMMSVSAYLTKPVKQSELLLAIEDTLSAGQRKSNQLVGVAEVTPAKIASLRILLAEDGITNQKLAVALLTKWGHHVTVANNGQEAVHAYEREHFDLVLMDVQMPEMDGLEATACIRAIEQKSHRHVTIIAMTARAMKGDRERCLESGMDGYVAKPIRQRDLYQAIAPHFPADTTA